MTEEEAAKVLIKPEALRDYMSDLSEKYWSAGWLSNCEYDIWDAFITGEPHHGFDLNREERDALKAYVIMLGGWHTYDEFLNLKDWLNKYYDHKEAVEND